MRAKSEIMESLTAKMSSSDVWKKLKSGLLGRELLALGAEIISESENVKDTMILQMNPETADKYGLYLLSQMNEIPITNIKPSSVVVEMLPRTKSFAPYELNYNVGNVAFYNTEYTMQGKTVSLLNGTYKNYVRGNAVAKESAVLDGETSEFYDGGTLYRHGIKLGNAYPDSIAVYDVYDLEIPRYTSDIALSNTVGVMYKVVTGVDGVIYIHFVCPDGYSEPTDFRIEWLDHSADEFDVDDETTVRVNNDDVAVIKYTSQGTTDDLNFMRLQLKKEMAKYNGFNTPKTVEQYVRGLPYVLDAKCEKSESGINVYIKPSSYLDLTTYLEFSEIAAHISLNSILFPNIKVKTGNQIKFGIEISGVSDVKLQNGIKNLLQEKFSYNNLTFNSVINVGNILSEIYGKYGVVPTINMTIQEPFVQDKSLSFKPIKNSLKLYGIGDNVVAWEENGLLYGMANNSNQIPFFMFKVVASMGTMFLLAQDCTKTPVDTKTRNYFDITGSRVIDGYYYNDAFYYDSEHTDLIDPDSNRIYKDITDPQNPEYYEYNYDDQTYEPSSYSPDEDRKYSTYDTDITFSMSSYNKFYLYDASTNTIKPFDGTMQNLLYTDSNPSLKYGAWNTDNQAFGNLYDIKFLSTNNALVVQMVFKSAGTEVDETDESNPKLKYWSENNTVLYSDYLNGEYTGYENNSEYKGKYQTMFFINNPLALKNPNYDGWQTFQDASHGNPNKTNGFYKGLRNVADDNSQLNIKSNWFVHNNKSYYAYEISDKYVYITNGAKNIAVSLNGSFLGMMPYENDLYVVNEKYVTRIVGFEGLKEKEEIYQIYKDFNTTLTIKEIIREFDNCITFKTVTNEYYVATGFEIIAGNKMGFKDLRQIFDDVTVENDCKIGGCTKDYVTLYKVFDDDASTEINETGFMFYCYDLNTGKTSIYNKTSDYEVVPSENENTETEDIVETENVAVWWGKSTGVIASAVDSDDNWHGSRLFYLDENDDYTEIPKEKYCDLFFVKVVGGDNGGVLCIDNIEGKQYAYQVFVTGSYTIDKNDVAQDIWSYGDKKYIVSGKNLHWNYDGKGIDSDYIAGFYKQCINAMALLESTSDLNIAVDKRGGKEPTGKPFYNLYSKSTNTKTTDGFIAKKETQELRTVNTEIQVADGTRITKQDSFESLINSTVYSKNNSGDGYLSDVAVSYTPSKIIYFKSKQYGKQGTVTEGIETFKMVTKKYYTRTTTTVTNNVGINYNQSDDTKELVTIGYFDETKNSCINDKGSEVAYVRYYTQNPNIANDSYLVLDENEIKFI